MEDTESWKGVLSDLTDGNQGLLKAINDIWPEVPRQCYSVHRIRNVLARIPKKRQDKVRKALHHIFYAACLDDDRGEVGQFLSYYQRESHSAAETLAKHLEECLLPGSDVFSITICKGN